ncbi:uncharacterized protein LOC142986730 [Anticarsia gemmatalis]|uniref:uncharacterized protein LOC142986730 n=1 Tax=Anticarsia gemmatalis TaxID=129554 RepID=UPI003F75889D
MISVALETEDVKDIREKTRNAEKALIGKTPAQKEIILKDLALSGIPLPDGKTELDKLLVNKVLREFGLPPKGTLQMPLDGMSPIVQRKILRGLYGIKCTQSERNLAQVRKPQYLPASENMRTLKATKPLQVLEGRSKAQKEKILRELANQGIPLPEGYTESDKELIHKIRNDLRVSPEPKSSAMKIKYASLQTDSLRKKYGKATDYKLINPPQKKPYDIERLLSKARSPSEKALIDNLASDKLRKSKVDRLVTPNEDQSINLQARTKYRVQYPTEKLTSVKQKQHMVPANFSPTLKSKAMKDQQIKATAAGLSPKGPERILAHKIRKKAFTQSNEIEMLPETRRKTLPLTKRQKIYKDTSNSMKDGIGQIDLLSPELNVDKSRPAVLDEMSLAQKEKFLRGLARSGIPMPEGKTPSEKSLINKIRSEEPKYALFSSDRLKKAKALGLITPLANKPPNQKEQIMRGLAELGLPVPEGSSPSEIKLSEKIHKAYNLPPYPKGTAGTNTRKLVNIDDLTLEEKRKLLNSLGDTDNLPIGLLPEKAFIARRKIKVIGDSKFAAPDEKKRIQREKILRSLAEAGIPLPKGTTPSENYIIDKIRAELPIKARLSIEKLKKAKALGLITPLVGKAPEEKERIMKGLAEQGLPFPKVTTPSEKKLTEKIRQELNLPLKSKPPSPPGKHGAAVNVNKRLVQSGADKEKLLRNRENKGLPHPKDKYTSSKFHSPKINQKLGLSNVSSDKQTKAKAAGLLTPIREKLHDEKKRGRGLTDTKVSLTQSRTYSEKSMVKHAKAESPIQPPLSLIESSRVRKSKKAEPITVSGDKTSSLKQKGHQGKVAKKAFRSSDTTEKSKDTDKVRVCDRGCGCDSKKIKFKHNIIRIRVSSPDLSSICSCSAECMTSIKSGAITDFEGIKVTIGSVHGITSFSQEYFTSNSSKLMPSQINIDNYKNTIQGSGNSMFDLFNITSSNNTSSAEKSSHHKFSQYGNKCKLQEWRKEFLRHPDRPKNLVSTNVSPNNHSLTGNTSSFNSIMIIKSESSLSLISTSGSDSSSTTLSCSDESITSTATNYFFPSIKGCLSSVNTCDHPNHRVNEADNYEVHVTKSEGNSSSQNSNTRNENYKWRRYDKEPGRLEYPESIHTEKSKVKLKNKHPNSVLLINYLNSEQNVTAVIDQPFSKHICSDSFLYLLVPSDCDEFASESTIYI